MATKSYKLSYIQKYKEREILTDVNNFTSRLELFVNQY